LGINDVICINNKPLYKIVESIHSKEIAILTDLDREGRRFYSILKEQFKRNGIKVNDRFRNYLNRNTKLRQIEGIERYLRRKRII